MLEFYGEQGDYRIYRYWMYYGFFIYIYIPINREKELTDKLKTEFNDKEFLEKLGIKYE